MDLYKVHLIGYTNEQVKKNNHTRITAIKMCMRKNVTQPDISPYDIVDRVTEETAHKMAEYLESIGCNVSIEESDYAVMDIQEQNAINFLKKSNSPVLCPRCNSNQITTGQRGYSIITGFIGSNKTVNRCAKCGYSWKP